MATKKNQQASRPVFELNRSRDALWYFTLNGNNGKVIMTSETYTRKENCIKAMIAVLNIASHRKTIFTGVTNDNRFGRQ